MMIKIFLLAACIAVSALAAKAQDDSGLVTASTDNI